MIGGVRLLFDMPTPVGELGATFLITGFFIAGMFSQRPLGTLFLCVNGVVLALVLLDFKLFLYYFDKQILRRKTLETLSGKVYYEDEH